jgi:hypothetical protein
MTKEEYIRAVEAVLSGHTQRATRTLAAALALVPPKAREVHLMIVVDQDGEGFLDVCVELDGPQANVLHKAIAPHRNLFSTCMTEDGRLDPALPLMDIHCEEFSVRDILTDCASSWIRSVWEQSGKGTRIPVVVFSGEGCGTNLPLRLNP